MTKISLFVLKRAWLFGICTRTEIARALEAGNSPNRINRIMDEAVRDYPRTLFREQYRGVRPIPDASWPHEADPSRALDVIAQRYPAIETGVFEDDVLPFLLPAPAPSVAGSDLATREILLACTRDVPLRILYVGLRRGEEPRYRNVWPVAMEHTGRYWRMHAQDLDAAPYTIKSFVLARTIEAQRLVQWKKPADFRRLSDRSIRARRHLQVYFSQALSTAQVDATRRLLGIGEDGTLTLADHEFFDFKREYAGVPVAPEIAWPLFSRIDEM